jgi:pyruvate,orthophosphate dikinase
MAVAARTRSGPKPRSTQARGSRQSPGKKFVYQFSEGSAAKRDLLGGKGANLAEMARIGGPVRVPPGFTISTEACVAYMRSGRFPTGLDEQLSRALAKLESKAGKRLGDRRDPLLVSVRSGARESMPGMMDTVLNLGLNDESVLGLAERTGNERFAWDSYRRFVQMFGNVVRDIDGSVYEKALTAARRRRGVQNDADLDASDLQRLTSQFKSVFRRRTGEEFPADARSQLRQAIRAVFDSWNGERAVEYRRQNRIPDEWGTAVNVQQMVFGNKGRSSGSGVAFSRDGVTGEPEPSGDFLIDAQGEDVVSGVRNTLTLRDFKRAMPKAHAQLVEILRTLESHYKDMQDVEFTVEEGILYMLQTRSAKRPAQAAVRVAVDMVGEGLLTKKQALKSIDAGALEALTRDAFDPRFEYEPLAVGVAASPGAAKGRIVFTAQDAVKRAGAGDKVILVREFTEADDVAGFEAAEGILTSKGGKASHAALVARDMGKPCVAGAAQLEIDVDVGAVSVDGTRLAAGDLIAIDGTIVEFRVLTVDGLPAFDGRLGEYEEGFAIDTEEGAREFLASIPEDLMVHLGKRVWLTTRDGNCVRYGVLEMPE